MIQRPSLCRSCSLLRAGGKCAAFPEGIPEGIILWGGDHRQPWPGDKGVRYHRNPGEDAEIAFKDWADSRSQGAR